MKFGSGDIGPEFLGFMTTYFYLSKIIPKERIIVDLGCAYAFQAYYFRKHAGYIGVDCADFPKLKTDNSRHYLMSIDEFAEKEAAKIENPFAICNYCSTNTNLIRSTFEDIYVFYVSKGDMKKYNMVPLCA
jgi:hypothetical protein